MKWPRTKRRGTHCKHGHAYTRANSYYHRTKEGYLLRACRKCVLRLGKRSDARQRAGDRPINLMPEAERAFAVALKKAKRRRPGTA